MVSPPSGGESASSCVGQSVNRPVCDLPHREAAPVLLASPGSPGRPWDDLDLYAFPPFALVGRVIARVQQSSRVAMTLVAPLWPEKEWFADLLLLLTQPPLALPCWDKLLRQPHFSLFHQGVHALKLHAWRLSSDTTESRAFREELLESCQGSQRVLLSIVPVEMGDLLWLVSWKGRCSSQRHCSCSRGLSDSLTPGQGLVRLCC